GAGLLAAGADDVLHHEVAVGQDQQRVVRPIARELAGGERRAALVEAVTPPPAGDVEAAVAVGGDASRPPRAGRQLGWTRAPGERLGVEALGPRARIRAEGVARHAD